MNKKFVVYDAAGNILRTGNCPARDLMGQAGEGEHVIEGEACCINDAVDPKHKTVVKNGCVVKHEQGPGGVPKGSGLSTAVQLDLLWQAMDAGTFPKAEPFYSAIKAQKEAA